MSESTLNNTLSPEGALVLLRELLPGCMVPSSGTALLSASKRLGGPPSRLIVDGVPGRGRRRYDRAELAAWAVSQLPQRVRDALDLLLFAESVPVVFEADEDEDGACLAWSGFAGREVVTGANFGDAARKAQPRVDGEKARRR